MAIGKRFGQTEQLTRRLHNLVRSYPKGLGILKEFIQNADDAEADEIVFVIDEKHYETEGLPVEMQWVHQSPALLVFNNKPFTDDDLASIQNLGESGKSLSVDKTGRFGLGFNACYNVTDVPSFFTCGSIYFFDPHFRTVPGATISSPGRSFSVDDLNAEGWPLLNSLELFLKSQDEFEGVVFRLPFRSAEQSIESKIRNDTYTVEDALDVVSELSKMGSAILLFLKHLRKITCKWRNKHGDTKDILSIEAINSDAINQSRSEINALLNRADVEQLLQTLEDLGNVFGSCIHEYKVITPDEERIETWRVVDGFFVDAHREIVETCRRMIETQEKAIPYAGAAYPLTDGVEIKGRVFCFLPTPMSTGLPIQLNGYFDLEDSRQGMFLDASTHGSARVRYEWNQGILKTAAAQAYVQLVEELRSDFEEDIAAYYNVFPKNIAEPSSWEAWITGAFYKNIVDIPVIRVAMKDQWKCLADTRSLPPELNSMRDVLIDEQFLPIPEPLLSQTLQDGFMAVDISVPVLTPYDLRIELKVHRDFDCPLHKAPRKCLRSFDYLVGLLRFCLTDEPGDGIRGLPLVVDCRNHLRTIGLTAQPLYISRIPHDLEIFSDKPESFVDPEFLNSVDLAETEDVKLLDFNDERFLIMLREYVNERAVGGQAPKLNKAPAGALTETWLIAVFNRILVSEDIDRLKDELHDIPLVPDQGGTLWAFCFATTPLLFEGDSELKIALKDLSVPLVTANRPEFYRVLKEIEKKCDCIWRITPRDLIDTIAGTCKDRLGEYRTETNIHRALLDYLSSDDAIRKLKDLNNCCLTLKGLHLFPTTSGSIVDLNGEAFVSQGFAFPQVNFEVILLADGPQLRWRRLYELLAVPALSRSRLIREYLLPEFESFDSDSQIKALSWLRDEISNAQSEDEANGDSSNLLELVRSESIIICSDGELRPPRSVYQPGSQLARDVLGEQAAFPDMDGAFAKTPERWLEFFRQLNMPTEPQLEDVLEYVKSIVEEEPDDAILNRILAVYRFVKDLVDSAYTRLKELPQELEHSVSELRDIAWIPVRQESKDLLCFVPPDRYYVKPSAAYFPRVGQLVASQAAITTLSPEPDKKVRSIMGFPEKPPIELVSTHFRNILEKVSTDYSALSKGLVEKPLAQIYRYFGGSSPLEDADEDADDEQTSEALTELECEFADIPCIWDQEKKWFWLPKHVFAENVRYMEPWRRTIRTNEDAIERGYAALGRRQAPAIDDWTQVLGEISESGKSVTDYSVAGIVWEILRRIIDELNSEDVFDEDVPVPTRNGSMARSGSVFMLDAPWYEAMSNDWDIPILVKRYESLAGIENRLGIKSLHKSIDEKLAANPAESEDSEASLECSRLEALINSAEFINGMLRLLKHEDLYVSNYELNVLRQIKVKCVKVINIRLYLHTDSNEILLGDSETESYWDDEAGIVMLSEKRARYFCDDLATILVRATQQQSLKNLAPLVRILHCSHSEVHEVLNDLKIRDYASINDAGEGFDDEIILQQFPDENDEHVESKGEEPEDEQYTENAQQDNTETIELDEGEDDLESIEDSAHENILFTSSDSTASRRKGTNNQPSAIHGSGVQSGGAIADSGNTSAGRATSGGRGNRHECDMEAGAAGGSSGSTASARSQHNNNQRRLLSYVSQKADVDHEHDELTGEARNKRLRVGNAAVEIVLQHEESKGWTARNMAHANPGYDVISERKGEDNRYIEVKGTEAAWGERGVALSAIQFFYSQRHPDRDYWLYVVENVFSPNPKVHEIHSPLNLVDQFVFDGGWREAAETTVAKPSLPSPGDAVIIDGQQVGVVERILPAGKFPLVLYRDSQNKQMRKRLADIRTETGVKDG